MSCAGMLKPAVKLRPEEKRQAIWEVIQSTVGAEFTTRLIARKTWAGESTINDYLAGLASAGYLERKSPDGPGKCAAYRLVRDTGTDAPRVRPDGTEVTQGRGREQMWRTMRILGVFTPRELAITASTEEIKIAPNEAGHYINRLHAAGYLRLSSKGKPGYKQGTGAQASYQFMRHMHTGPKAPQVQRNKQVYDPNLRQIVIGGVPNDYK
jgi:hypothetical protein